MYDYLYEYTESEFLEAMRLLMVPGVSEQIGLTDYEFEKLSDHMTALIVRDVQHPLDIGLMYSTEHPHLNSSPEKLITEIKRHCEAERIPCFRKS
ncbi:bacteriocin immunity protein [Thaumasiovibrio subtropicus]|nr:bacteriocin immunity protein [Thaumasiovibrio subtropicus]